MEGVVNVGAVGWRFSSPVGVDDAGVEGIRVGWSKFEAFRWGRWGCVGKGDGEGLVKSREDIGCRP